MRRMLLSVVIALVSLPGLITAQDFERTGALARVTVSPWLGYRVGYSQAGSVLTTRNDTTRLESMDFEPEGALAAGFDAGVRVGGLWSVLGGFAYTAPSDVFLTVNSDNGEEFFVGSHNAMYMAKLGVALDLREQEPDFRLHRPTAALFLMPALVFFDPVDEGLAGDLDDRYSQLAVNFGFKGETPIWQPNLLFQIGAEDYFTFWNEDRPARRAVAGDDQLTAEFDFDPSHILLLRVGLTYQF